MTAPDVEAATREHLLALTDAANRHGDDQELHATCSYLWADFVALASRVETLETALREIERMAGAAGFGETPARPLAERARSALAAQALRMAGCERTPFMWEVAQAALSAGGQEQR